MNFLPHSCVRTQAQLSIIHLSMRLFSVTGVIYAPCYPEAIHKLTLSHLPIAIKLVINPYQLAPTMPLVLESIDSVAGRDTRYYLRKIKRLV